MFSEIAKPRVRKPRVFINCHPDPPPEPPFPPPKTCPADLSMVICTPIHSHTSQGGSLGILKGFLGGGERGRGRFMKTRGFRFLSPGFRNLRCFFFAPPSLRNRRSQFSAISMVFLQILVDFHSISIDCLLFSPSFSQLQSLLTNLTRFQPV